MIGSYSANQLPNDNGLRVIHFISSKHMTICSTFFQHAPSATRGDRHNRQIDHVLIDRMHCSDISDVKTFNGSNVDLDHFLIMVKNCQNFSMGVTRVRDSSRGSASGRQENRRDALRSSLAYGGTSHQHCSGRSRKISHLLRGERKEWFDEQYK